MYVMIFYIFKDGDIRHFQYVSRGRVPWSGLQANVRQATACCHDGLPDPVLQKADVVLHDPVALHPTHGVFSTNAAGRKRTICGFLRGREFSSRRLFLGLDHADVL